MADGTHAAAGPGSSRTLKREAKVVSMEDLAVASRAEVAVTKLVKDMKIKSLEGIYLLKKLFI